MSRNPNWEIIAPVKKQINFAVTLSILSSICTVTLLVTIAYLVQALLARQLELIYLYFILIIALTIAAYLLRLHAFNQSHFAAFRLEAILRKDMSVHIAQLPLGFISTTGAGAISKIMQEDVKALHAFVADATPLFARAYVFPFLTFFALLWFDWRMALLCLAVLFLGMMILASVMKKHDEMNRVYSEARENVNSAVIEFVQAMPVVRTFDGGQKSFRRYENALLNYKKILTEWYKESGLVARISMLVLNPLPTFVVILVVGSYLWQQGHIRFEVLIATLLLGTGMVESMMPYMSLYHLIEKSKISAGRILQLLSEKPLAEPSKPQVPQHSAISFQQVNFSYPERDVLVLKNINFEVAANSFTALVGTSGAGKSTIAKLIPRFWDVDSGAIKIGGINIKEMDSTVLMSQVAFVFQDNFLFSDSIANNIRLGIPNATDEQVQDAAKLAQADDFIRSFSQGYDTEVGERGINLSGGQRQRITIARAILQNRPILILDEATAFADAESEALLMHALKNLMQGKTVLMIAHRLSTIQNADQILVFEQGELSEQGNHQTLLEANGIYAKLWQAFKQAQQWHINLNLSSPKSTGESAHE